MRGHERWERVRGRLYEWLRCEELFLYGQRDSLRWIADNLRNNGVIIADEVGLGKTRLALLTMMAALEEGCNVVAVVPPGLLFQWQQEADVLALAMERHLTNGRPRKWSACMLRSYGDLYSRLSEREEYPLANQRAGRWVLISQRFDLYRIKSNARAWRLELPALVRAHHALQNNERGNNRWIQYRKQRGSEQDRAARYLSELRLSPEMRALLEDERLRPNGGGEHIASEQCIEIFRQGGEGRRLLMHLVGKLIGPVDLLVMDEAHKSREDGDVPQTQLGRLLSEILEAAPDHRRISMTATPIELNTDQWRSLLHRTGIGPEHPSWDGLEHQIYRFSSALTRAQNRPDQPDALEALLLAAASFTQALKPFVTRRRRINQREMQELLPQGRAGAHPHRALAPHPIEIGELSNDWRKMVLALEGQGLAAKGLSGLSFAHRQSDIRYSSGLNCEFDVPPLEGDHRPSRKEQRERAWAGLQRRLSAQSSAPDLPWLWSHPRVVRGADRIEELCEFSGLIPREKVLVFGRFSEPMRVLRDTLNARHILRIIDDGGIAFVPQLHERNHDRLLAYVYEQLRSKGRFTKVLKEDHRDLDSLLKEVDKARHRYERARDVLRDKFDVDQDDWIASQPGDRALKRLDPQTVAHLFELLRADVFDKLLHAGRDPRQLSREEIQELARSAWVTHLACIVHGDEDVSEDDDEAGRPSNILDNEELRVLDRKGDGLEPERIRQYLQMEPRSAFCRILDGSVEAKTRRSVQASFNRHETGPYVLIAQSIVGREGLNLHKACRRVFLFHPEWNPAVLEQQIGRVDRIESLWTQLAKEWNRAPGASPESFPRIEIEALVFRGTYDEYQSSVLRRRRASLNAQLFGALLDEDVLPRVPEEYREKLAKAAPAWDPSASSAPPSPPPREL